MEQRRVAELIVSFHRIISASQVGVVKHHQLHLLLFETRPRTIELKYCKMMRKFSRATLKRIMKGRRGFNVAKNADIPVKTSSSL